MNQDEAIAMNKTWKHKIMQQRNTLIHAADKTLTVWVISFIWNKNVPALFLDTPGWGRITKEIKDLFAQAFKTVLALCIIHV